MQRYNNFAIYARDRTKKNDVSKKRYEKSARRTLFSRLGVMGYRLRENWRSFQLLTRDVITDAVADDDDVVVDDEFTGYG